MAYVTQEGNSCGAYSTAYYLWHSNGILPTSEGLQGDTAQANAIYAVVQFGETAQTMPHLDKSQKQKFKEYSNPVRLMEYLLGKIEPPIVGGPPLPTPPPNPTFYHNGENIISCLLNTMNDKGFIPDNISKLIKQEVPPIADNNGYLIALCAVNTTDGTAVTPLAIHYVMMKREGEALIVIDPNIGKEVNVSAEVITQFLNGKQTINNGGSDDLLYLQAGIWLL